MCGASGTHARIDLAAVPLIDAAVLDYYLAEGCIPGGTQRNWQSYGQHVSLDGDRAKYLLADPQTSGGLLVAVDPKAVDGFTALCSREGHPVRPIGEMVAAGQGSRITVV